MADAKDFPGSSATVPKNQNEAVLGNEDLREDLIVTATKFLQSPKVRETPISHRKAFLARKGLTEREIQEAINRAGESVGPFVDETGAAVSSYRQQPAAVPPRPLPATWRDYAQAMVFVSGASYVAYKFVRGYVMPSWFNVPDPEQERLRRMDENMNDVQNGLKFLVDSVQQTLGVVQQQQETLNRLVNELIEKDKTSATQERAIQELRSEVATIKSLLLSRDQFAPLPSIANSSSSNPSIPAWQLPPSRQQALMNGTYKNGPGNTHADDRRFILGSDGDEDDVASADGITGSDEPYVSATGSENGEKTTPV